MSWQWEEEELDYDHANDEMTKISAQNQFTKEEQIAAHRAKLLEDDKDLLENLWSGQSVMLFPSRHISAKPTSVVNSVCKFCLRADFFPEESVQSSQSRDIA